MSNRIISLKIRAVIMVKLLTLVGMVFVLLSVLLSSLFYYMAPLWVLLLLLSHRLWYYVKKITHYLTIRANEIEKNLP